MPIQCINLSVEDILLMPPFPISKARIQTSHSLVQKAGVILNQETVPKHYALWTKVAWLTATSLNWEVCAWGNCVEARWISLRKLHGGKVEGLEQFIPESWLQMALVPTLCLSFIFLAPSVKRSNCYMVWGGDIVATSQRSSRSNVDLEIGCLVDLAMGMLSFSANGRELGTCYQVGWLLEPRQQCSCLRSLLLTCHIQHPISAGDEKTKQTKKRRVASFCPERGKIGVGGYIIFIDWSDMLFIFLGDKVFHWWWSLKVLHLFHKHFLYNFYVTWAIQDAEFQRWTEILLALRNFWNLMKKINLGTK